MAKNNKNNKPSSSAENRNTQKAMREMEDYFARNKSFMDSMLFAMTNLGKSDFFIKITNSKEDIQKAVETLKEMTEEVGKQGSILDQSFENIFSRYSKGKDEIYKSIDVLAQKSPEIALGLRDALQDGKISDFFKEFGKDGLKAFQDIMSDKKGFKLLKSFLSSEGPKDIIDITEEMLKLADATRRVTEHFFSWRKTLSIVGEQLFRSFSPKNIIPIWNDFDKIINETQKNFGIQMDANAHKFTELISKSQQFGMGAQQNSEFISKLSDGINDTTFGVLEKAAYDLKAMHQATGLAVDETADLAAKMLFYGRTSKTVAKFTQDTMNLAQRFGLNSKKVLQEISKAIPDARKLGWTGGEKALAAMVVQSEKLGQSMQGISSAATKLRTLEGSIEGAASLALVGVNVNAIQMLGAARRGGKEFSTFLSNITKDIGSLKKNGEVDFSPIDIDRLQVIAEATGQTIEDLQNQIAKTAIRNRKIDLLPSSMFGSNMTDEQKEFLLNATKIGDNGKIELVTKINGISDINKLTPKMIDSVLGQKKTLEQQALANQTFMESVTNLKQSLLNIFTYLQPTIAYATSLVQKLGGWISQLGPTGQKFLGGLLLFAGVFFSAAKHFYAGYWQGVGFNAAVNKGGFLSGVKDFFGKFNPRNIFKSRTTIPSGVLPGSMNVPPPGAANNVAGMGQALKSFPDAKQLLSLSVALVGLGVAFVGIGFGIKLAADGLSGLVGAFNNISNAGVALGAVAVVMGGFVGMLAVMIPVIGALGATSVAVWPGLLALGFVFAGIGLGINLASKGIAILVQSFEGMVVSISKVAKSAPQLMYMAGALSFLAPALFAFGAAALFAMPGMIALAAGFALLTPSLSITIPFLKLLSELKLDSLKGIGSSLLSLTPGLLAFSSIGLIAPLLLMAGAATNLLFKGISSLSSNVDTKFLKNVTDDLSSLVGGLIKFSTIGVFSGLISLASRSLFILGNALNQFNNSKNVDFKNISDTLNSLYSPLIKFSTLGLFAAPMILASTGLRILSSTLKPISEGFNSLNNVNFTKFSGLSSGILSLIPGLLSIASIGIMSVPILLGATVMNTIGSSISNMITGFNSLDKVNLSGLNSMTKEIPNITKSLLGLSVLGIIAIPFSIASSLLAGAGKMLGSSSTGFKEFLSVNWEGFGSATRSMSDFIGSLVKFSFLSIVAAPVLLGATLLGSAGSLLAMAAKGFNLFGSVNTSNISDVVNSMTGLASSLTKLVTLNFIAPAILSGASVLGLAGIAFSTAFNGFDKISKVNWSGLNKMSTVLSDIAQPLLGFSAIGLISPLLTTAGIAISSLGNGIVSLAKANFSNLSGVSDIFSKLSPALIKFSAIGLISVPVMAGASALGSIGKSLGLASDGFKSMSGVEWSSIGRMGNVLNDVVPILSNFGFKSIASAPGLWLMNSTLSTLASTMHKLSDPINISSEALGEMADNLQKLQTVAKTIDLSKLRDIGDASDKMINAKINYSSSKQEVSESKSETIKVDPIQVEVVMKYPDGKEMHRLIVEANAYRT